MGDNEKKTVKENEKLLPILEKIKEVLGEEEFFRILTKAGYKGAKGSYQGYLKVGHVAEKKVEKIIDIFKININNITDFDEYEWIKTFIKNYRQYIAEDIFSNFNLKIDDLQNCYKKEWIKKFIKDYRQYIAEGIFSKIDFKQDKNELKKIFEKYKGIYICKYQWAVPDIPNRTYKKAIFTTFVEIYEYTEDDEFIKIKSTTYSEHKDLGFKTDYEWGWNGFMIPLTENGFLIILDKEEKRFPTIICVQSSLRVNKTDALRGIFLSVPSSDTPNIKIKPNLSATKVSLYFLKDGKLETDDFKKLEIDYNLDHKKYIHELNSLDERGLLSYIPPPPPKPE